MCPSGLVYAVLLKRSGSFHLGAATATRKPVCSVAVNAQHGAPPSFCLYCCTPCAWFISLFEPPWTGTLVTVGMEIQARQTFVPWPTPLKVTCTYILLLSQPRENMEVEGFLRAVLRMCVCGSRDSGEALWWEEVDQVANTVAKFHEDGFMLTWGDNLLTGFWFLIEVLYQFIVEAGVSGLPSSPFCWCL